VGNSVSIDDIKKLLRVGNDQKHFIDDVLPLFLPNTKLYNLYNDKLKMAFTSAFTEGGASNEESLIRWNGISNIIINGTQNNLELKEIESQLLSFYKTFLKPAQTEINQNARATRCYLTVRDYLIGDTVIDYGCGKGLLGEKIKTELNKNVYLVDNIDFNKSKLPLIVSDRNGKTNLSDKIADTSIAYLVLHHMDNPLSGLEELARITKKRLILMEGYIEDINYRYINQAIDWFFNRILLGVDMNVPLNFLKLEHWSILLEHVGPGFNSQMQL